MRRFAQLYEALDSTTSTLSKVQALVSYFDDARPEDAAWALSFFIGRRLKRVLSNTLLHELLLESSGLPEWLLGECYSAAGDFAETISLLVPAFGGEPNEGDVSLSEWVRRVLALPHLEEAELKPTLLRYWRSLPKLQLYLFIKLLTGEFRVGVSSPLVIRALAEKAQLPAATIAHRLMGNWQPSATFFESLLSPKLDNDDISRPYPFFLASPLEKPVEELGPVSDWLVEWKWDGIRGQLVRRAGQLFLWSRGEELLTERFPEIRDAAAFLPDGTVLDGEVLAYADGAPLLFSVLQRRIGRQKLTPSILQTAPAVFMAFDLLEQDGQDVRGLPLQERRARLLALLARRGETLLPSAEVQAQSWEQLTQLREGSRARNVEGFLLKRWQSPYRDGRKRGDWWKWKVEPYAIDAVLVYAQPGSGRRATLLTDYTFAVWHQGELLPIAKAYSGLSDAEIAEQDAWIRGHTLSRYGPVRAVEPVRVFELHFEALAPSSRHKSGIAVRFPRISRWRTDKTAEQADTLEQVKALLKPGV